jgi:hypothetical protein
MYYPGVLYGGRSMKVKRLFMQSSNCVTLIRNGEALSIRLFTYFVSETETEAEIETETLEQIYIKNIIGSLY